MKKAIILFFALAIGACKQGSKKEEIKENTQVMKVESAPMFTEALAKVFDTHGGLNMWRAQRTLTYEMPKTDFTETHTIDLWSRRDRVDTPQFSMGFDGNQVWLLDTDKEYKGDAGFYHNLMFYFYAMPFVLADDGINYSKTEALEYEGKSYPGVSISYNSGIGTSPKDEYFIHFDPETNKMSWLGYTVTYRTGEVSDNVKWIRYNDWQEIDGLTLPKSITWYNYEGTKILDARNTVQFENISLSKMGMPESFYAKPESAIWIESKKN
ncbi:DUF6503 family protein [Flagellimonas pacifica]|uniref:Threonine synthase n=1 Tax=Flagellimonas pacifica TaxID=1247520 RepID=A0A285MT51_9FLAO|nr:DUF6503 family protein [Allomuricauda parva]SNZ00370.1 hypothetical protein SAMN06265377_2192 [Allomuricauda parva]